LGNARSVLAAGCCQAAFTLPSGTSEVVHLGRSGMPRRSAARRRNRSLEVKSFSGLVLTRTRDGTHRALCNGEDCFHTLRLSAGVGCGNRLADQQSRPSVIRWRSTISAVRHHDPGEPRSWRHAGRLQLIAAPEPKRLLAIALAAYRVHGPQARSTGRLKWRSMSPKAPRPSVAETAQSSAALPAMASL
jgi:hypothetical protein